MLVELGMNFGARAEATLLVGLTVRDVERLRAGEELSFRPRDAGLVFYDEVEGGEPRTLVLAFGSEGEPKRDGRLRLTESMIEWMRDATPLSNNLEDLGFPEGKLVLIHGKSDEETVAAVRRHQKMLARTLGAPPVVAPTGRRDARPSWALILACAVGSVASFAAAFSQPDALGRWVTIACGVALAGVGGWALRAALRHRRGA